MLGALLVLLIAAILSLQLPAVQRYVARQVISYLEDSVLDGHVTLEGVSLQPFRGLVLEGLVVTDDHPLCELDTVLRAESVVATFSVWSLLDEGNLVIRRASLSGIDVNLTLEGGITNIERVFGIKTDPDSPPYTGNLFEARKVEADRIRFRMIDCVTPVEMDSSVINWWDLDARLDFRAHDVSYKGGIAKAIFDDITVTEKSGYIIEKLTGSVALVHGQWDFNDLYLKDPWSEVALSHLGLSYEGRLGPAFKDFIRSVRMEGEVTGSYLSTSTLAYLNPVFKDMSADAIFSGRFEGTVDDLRVSDLRFRENPSGITGNLQLAFKGLPQFNDADLDIKAEGLRFSSSGLTTFLKGIAPGAGVNLSSFAPRETFTFDGTVKGKLDNMAVNGQLLTGGHGTLRADAVIGGVMTGDATSISGEVSTAALNLGRLIGTNALGECTLRTRVNSIVGGRGGISADFDTLVVDRISLLGYDYHSIIGKGGFHNGTFDGRIACLDPEANFIFSGNASLPTESAESKYNFDLTLAAMDLHRLGYSREGRADLSMHADVDIRSDAEGTLIGRVDLDNLTLRSDRGRHNIGQVQIRAKDSANDIRLRSGFANATFTGSASILRFIDDLKALTLGRDLTVLARDVPEWSGNDYSLEVRVADIDELLGFFAPDLYIENGTTLRAAISPEGSLSASLRAPILAYGKHYIRDARASVTGGGSLGVRLQGERMDIGGFEMLSPAAVLIADDNILGASYSYDNKTSPPSGANLMLTGALSRNDRDSLMLTARIDPSTSIWFDDRRWNISSGDIVIGDGRASIKDKLRFNSADESLDVSGGIASSRPDTLHLDMKNFNIAVVNSLTDLGFDLQGRAGGTVEILSPLGDRFGLLAQFRTDSTSIAGRPAGTLAVDSKWNEDTRSFDFAVANNLGGSRTLSLGGAFNADSGEIEAQAEFDGADLGYVAPIVKGVFSEFGGDLYGRVRVAGPMSDLAISSEGGMVRGGFLRLDFTGVKYFLEGPVSISDKMLGLDGLTVSDGADGLGRGRGGIRYNRFQDFDFDIGIDNIRSMKAIDLKASDNDIFWGDISMNGNVEIKGPLSGMEINVNATTTGPGAIHIPLDYSTDSSTGLLTFVDDSRKKIPEPEDRFAGKLGKMEEEEASKSDAAFKVGLNIRATQETEAHIEIDPASGNALTGRGSGNISIGYESTSGNFSMGGDYTVSSGKFHFSAMSIASRDFELVEGGRVRFNGDVMDTELDVSAIYKTKTSLATLIADSTATRTTVNCLVGVSDRLSNPKVELGIEFPEVNDPTVLAKAQSALNTQDQIQKQFLSLLISNTFLPSEQNGIVNNSSTNLLSSVTDVMSSQLNSILQQLDIPLDLGFNYEQTDSGNDLFDVAVSTQLFNNRVTINGNLGNREWGGSGGTDMVGDLDVAIKLNQRGNLTFNLFSRSSDIYKGYLDNLQRNGAGFTVQMDFNSFRELAKRIFEGPQRRRDRERTEILQRRNQKTTIKITREDE